MMSGESQKNRVGLLVLLVASSAGPALLLSGCGSPAKITSPPAVRALQGMVRGGQQPLPQVTLQLYATDTTVSPGYGAAALPFGASFTSDANGEFAFPNTLPACQSGNPQMFLVGSGGVPFGFTTQNPDIKLMVGLGPCSALVSALAGSGYYVKMNELTTVATVWSLSGFMKDSTHVGAPASNATGLANAFSAINEVVGLPHGATIGTGLAPGTLPAGGTIDTATVQKINTLGNVLESCINSAGGSPSDPTDGLNSGTNCDKLFYLTTVPTPGSPATPSVPADTVVAALNIAQHPGGKVFNVTDAQYLADLWALQGDTIPAFPADLSAQPNDWTIAINYAGGGLTGSTPQSIAVDGNGNVWVTNKPASGTGSVVELDNTGNAIQNYTNFVNSPYGVAIDTANNAWITNTGDSPNSITMISSLGVSTNYPSPDLHTPAGIAIDGAGNVWVVNSASGANSLAGFTSGGTELAGSPYTGGGLNGPTSIAVNPIAPGSPGPMVTRKKALDPQ